MSNTITQGPIGAAAPTPVPTTPQGTGSQEMGKDQFLKLLITQLRYQDPMDPSKPEEFASQLAQFSSLEGMQNIEKILTDQSAASSLNTLALKADLGASFIGRDVLAAGNSLELKSDGPSAVQVEVGTGGGTLTLSITDSSGKQVATQDIGFRAGGRQTLNVDKLPAGDYTYSVTAKNAAGTDVPVTTYTSGIVDSVSFQNGTVILKSGSLSFPLDNVVEVERAPAGAAALAAMASARIIPHSTESVHP
jgi:flagellar basal-body rod modification protein FlgD